VERARLALFVLMVPLLVWIGVLHFTETDTFVAIMPPYLPWHRELVWISGALEIALPLVAIAPRLRPLAGWGIAALLVAVFPANLHMAIEGIGLPGQPPPPAWVLWGRLPLQAVFLAWALFATGAVELVRKRRSRSELLAAASDAEERT
jgi:uncharacterized membrane protein